MPTNPGNTFDSITVRLRASNIDNGTMELVIRGDDRYFVLGPNGSGKSALIQHFVQQIPAGKAYRISAHRQTWFNSGKIEITAGKRHSANQNIVQEERQATGRWQDIRGSQRLGVLLFDLIAAENERARSIAHAVDEENFQKASSTAKEIHSPFERINQILRAGNLSVQLEASTGEEILAHHVDGQAFSVARLSDGERNAVILAAAVLTANSGTVLLIDEPERHLHRAIIEPLLTALFASRQDCPFIISTHELGLPVAAPEAKVLLPRSCQWKGDVLQSWDIDLLDPGTDLPDELKVAVLGSRKKILFVEGTFRSLDVPLYGLLFPDLTVIPKGSCTEVIRSVTGLRTAKELHWIQAFGLVDRDDRSNDGVATLQKCGVFALDRHSAEAIYYSDAAISAMANRQAETLGIEAGDCLKTAKETAVAALSDEATMNRMCARRSERRIREKVLRYMPTWKDIAVGIDAAFSMPVKETYEQEIAKYRSYVGACNLEGLISRYPVREAGALDQIATRLHFGKRSLYEQAVLALGSRDAEFRDELRSLLGPITAEINSGGTPTAEQPE